MLSRVMSLRFPLAVDHGMGRISIETDYAAHVEQLMKQVLFTNPGERINRPDFGCGIRRMVFAPNSQESASLAQVTIVQALERWLGSVIKVEEVKVKAVEEILEIRISYLLKIRREKRYLDVEVSI